MTPSTSHAGASLPTCVVVSDRPWNRDMAATLAARTGRRFALISEPAELSAEKLAALDADLVFFPHWSHRIDASVHERFECVIFHMTDLPFGRGGSPLQNLIARGIHETRISALRCVAGLDAGPIYLKQPLSLYGSAEEILLRANRIIEDMIVELVATRPEPVAQQGEPTIFRRRKPQDGDLAAAATLEQVFDMIRMLDAQGYPPAFLHVGPFTLEFSRAAMKTGAVVADVRIRRREASE